MNEANKMLKKFFLKLVLLHFCFCCVGNKWFCYQPSYFQKNQNVVKSEFDEDKIKICETGWNDD